MSISKFKVIIKFIFGGKEAVLDYVLDVANDFVAKLGDQKQEQLKSYVEQARKILAALEKYSNLCPSKWIEPYMETVEAFSHIVNALDDLKVTPEEIEEIYTSFTKAYAAWRAE